MPWDREHGCAKPGSSNRPEHPGYRALHAATDGLLRAVVEHHQPHPVMSSYDPGRVAYWQCHGCDPDSGFEDYPEWPCSTTQLIAEHHGIALEQGS